MFLPSAYPITEWIATESATVTTVIIRLFFSEFQKSVTRIASLKLSRLQVFGSDRIPLTLFVISDGCLNAMTSVMYSGKTIAESPKISTTIAVQFVFFVIPSFIIAAPPSYR